MTRPKTVKQCVADEVFALISTFSPNFSSVPGGVTLDSIETHRISNLEMQVRVKTKNQGTHYLYVKVSEPI